VTDHALHGRLNAVDHAIFYDDRFTNMRWNAMLRVFFSQSVIGRLGRDPAFFEHVQLPSVSQHYAGRARHAFAVLDPTENPFLQYITLGRYLNLEHGHPYLNPANLETLRNRMDRLEIHTAELEGFLGEAGPGAFTKFNLSDIFEWMSDDLYEQMLKAIVRASAPGGRLAYWNNLVLRSRPESLAHVLSPDPQLASDVHFSDRAFLYRDFQIETITDVPEGLR